MNANDLLCPTHRLPYMVINTHPQPLLLTYPYMHPITLLLIFYAVQSADLLLRVSWFLLLLNIRSFSGLMPQSRNFHEFRVSTKRLARTFHIRGFFWASGVYRFYILYMAYNWSKDILMPAGISHRSENLYCTYTRLRNFTSWSWTLWGSLKGFLIHFSDHFGHYFKKTCTSAITKLFICVKGVVKSGYSSYHSLRVISNESGGLRFIKIPRDLEILNSSSF